MAYAEKIDAQWRKLDVLNRQTIAKAGNLFLDIIAKDAAEGQTLWKMTAYALLNTLTKCDFRGSWVSIILDKGYLISFLKELVYTDNILWFVLLFC